MQKTTWLIGFFLFFVLHLFSFLTLRPLGKSFRNLQNCIRKRLNLEKKHLIITFNHITALQAIFKWFTEFDSVYSEELYKSCCPKNKTWRQHSLKEILNNNNIKWPRVLENKKPLTKEYHAAFHPVCVIQLTILPWRTCAKSTVTLVLF